MNADTDAADRTTTAAPAASHVSAPAAALDGVAGSSRPWTPEAAMEPIPPLAPPPARPGAGAHVALAPREPRAPLGVLTVAALVTVALLLALLVGLLLALR